jgi:hypothetical protein
MTAIPHFAEVNTEAQKRQGVCLERHPVGTGNTAVTTTESQKKNKGVKYTLCQMVPEKDQCGGWYTTGRQGVSGAQCLDANVPWKDEVLKSRRLQAPSWFQREEEVGG